MMNDDGLPNNEDNEPPNGTLQEMTDEPNPEDFEEDEPLTLDPSMFYISPPLVPRSHHKPRIRLFQQAFVRSPPLLHGK